MLRTLSMRGGEMLFSFIHSQLWANWIYDMNPRCFSWLSNPVFIHVAHHGEVVLPFPDRPLPHFLPTPQSQQHQWNSLTCSNSKRSGQMGLRIWNKSVTSVSKSITSTIDKWMGGGLCSSEISHRHQTEHHKQKVTPSSSNHPSLIVIPPFFSFHAAVATTDSIRVIGLALFYFFGGK